MITINRLGRVVAIKTALYLSLILLCIIFLGFVFYNFEFLSVVDHATVTFKVNGNVTKSPRILLRKSTGNYHLIHDDNRSLTTIIDFNRQQVGTTNWGFHNFINVFGVVIWYRNANYFMSIDDPMKGFHEGSYRFLENRVEMSFEDYDSGKQYSIVFELN